MDTTFMAPEKKLNIQLLRVTNKDALVQIEKGRKTSDDVYELYPWAVGTTLVVLIIREIAAFEKEHGKHLFTTPLHITNQVSVSERFAFQQRSTLRASPTTMSMKFSPCVRTLKMERSCSNHL